MHTFEYYKVKKYYNYKKAAEQVFTKLEEDLPLVVDAGLNPIQLMFNYERFAKKIVYSSDVNKFPVYYYVTSKKINNCKYLFDLTYFKKSLNKLYFYRCQR